MADGYISQIKTPDNKVYLLKDSESVRRDSELLTTNPFAPASLRGPYISKIDNAFYAADRRWSVTGTNISNINGLFDGNYESQSTITAGNTAVISIDFDPNHNNSAYFPGYPYGYILVSFYYTHGPANVSGRVYCNYNAHGIGWHSISFSPISDNTNGAIVYKSEHQGSYNISQLEITITADPSSNTSVTQIEMHLDRPSSNRTPFLSKYSDETLYYNLTAPKFIGALQGNADTATKFSSTRKIELTGAVTGSATTDGSNGWTISTSVNHNHDSTYSYRHLTDYDFTDTQPLSKYVTFDKSKPVGAPKEEWYNGFISSHSNYHASYIINGHTHQDEWYVGHGIWREANTPHAPAPTWYLLAHSGNVGTGDNNGQVKIAGQNVSVKGLKALAYKDSLAASDIPDIGDMYLKLSGGTMTGDIKGNASVALGTTTNPFHHIVLGGAVSNTLTADSTNPRITFQESNNGTQPVHLIYSDYDSYRSPAGLKIIGGTSASPAWLEVEGNIYAAAFKGNADTATTATYAANAANTQSNYGAKSFIVEGDADTYYPVIISGYTSHGAWTLLNISRDYAEQAPDTWNTSTHKGGLVLTILSNGDSAWGGNHQIGINKLNTILDLSQQYSTMVADMQVTNFGLVIWLRGGSAIYWITSNGGRSVTVTPKYEEYTANSNTIAPCTDINTARLNSFRWNNLWTIQNATNATTATRLNYNTTVSTKSGLQYTVGQLTIGTANGNAKEGSNNSPTLWSYPIGGTDATSSIANIQNLRLYWGSDGKFFRDIFISPNNSKIYHRTVINGTAGDWHTILDSNNTTAGTNANASLNWSSTYTLAKINGTDIKITTMAKPSYDFTDLTAHPTTLSGYGITDANIASGVITLGSNTITPVTSVNGHTGSSVDVTAADLGLSNAMHFIGVVANDSTNTPSDGSNSVPTITGLSSYTPAAGDVVIDKDNLREYVWSNGAWILLGFTTSSIFNSDSIDASSSDEPTWISNIQQATDGKISVQRQTIGTLGIGHGGTGKSEWTQWGIVYASATNTLAQVTAGASTNINQPLISGGAAAPEWYAGLTLTGNGTQESPYDATFNNTVTITGATTLSSTLSVAGSSTLTGKVGIGASPDNNYQLYVNGNSQFNGNLIPTITNNNADKTLGSSDNRWAKLYIGNADNHGDAYTPVYWNDGAPTTVVPVQYCEFTIKGSQSQSGVMLTHEAFTENSYVLQIVVTSGESNLNSPIRWASYSSGELALFCLTPPSGDVSGYILVSRGDSITPESEDFTGVPRPPVDPPTPPPVDPPSPPTPEPEGE